MKSFAAFGVALAALASGGCRETGTTQSAWKPVAQESMSDVQAAQRERALASREAMFTRLQDRLLEVIGSEDPAAAIVVCSEEAPQIAEDVSREHGVSIGRTSFRLRNPKNTPPAWAVPLVAKRVDEPAYLSDGDRLAALLPIRLPAFCLMCHGPEDAIPPDVQEALARHYPDDRATGFQVGELRGWFWIEVPPADGATPAAATGD